MQQIAFDFSTFPFSFDLVKSRRKTLVIYIKRGKVEVRAPLNASQKWINSFLVEKTPWILGQLKEQRKKKQESLKIAEGSQIQLQGQTLNIQVAIGRQNKAVRQGSTLSLFVKERNQALLEKLFHEWLLLEAKRYMPAMTEHYAQALNVRHKLKIVTFRKTKSKWGHCCQDGTIQFNWLVMLAPPPVLNYLIAHETSHLRHLNHSEKFWNTVALLCPDYKQHRDWLSDNGHRLWLA